MVLSSQSAAKLVLTTVLLALTLTGCDNSSLVNPKNKSQAEKASNTNFKQEEGKKKVLTSFTILADMAKNVAGDKLIVESITKIGAEIHGYEPTPQDLVKAEKADLVLYNGLNLERWMERFLGNVKDVPSVILTEGIKPIPIAEGKYANKPNPHAWMSPKNALIYVENIRQAFVELDPENADTYNANAQAYSEEIRKLDRTLAENLAKIPENQRYLVTCEGAFSYLAQDYNLKEIYLWALNAEQQSTPKQIQSVIEQVKSKEIPAVFCETTVNNEGQKQVAQATSAKFGGSLYVDSLSAEDGEVSSYLKLLRYDINTIINGLN